MNTFTIDSSSIRKQIKTIIEEHYNEELDKDFGMVVVKELIQNANDASAKYLHIGYHEGIKASNNQLLQSKALYFVNDGEFKKDDLISIHKMWDNAKSNNPNQIGKFGLGLKSVFNWCEAFFYFSSGISDTFKIKKNRENYNDKFKLFNPWDPTPDEIERHEGPEEEIKPYDKWVDPGEDDYLAVRSELKNIIGIENDWFCIWIPLRTKQTEIKTPYKNCYPGDIKDFSQHFVNENFIYEIATILPMLSSLDEIAFWDGKDKKYSLKNKDRLPKIDLDNKQNTITNNIKPLKSIIYYNNSALQTYISYKCSENNTTKKIIQNPNFPRDEDGRPEKAFNQGAVSITLIEEILNKGVFVLDWCVFLPLTQKRIQKNINDFSVYIKLHGWFFVDSGRNRLDFGENNNDLTIKQKWNRVVASENTLPQIIPLIKKMIDTKISDSTINTIAEKLHRTDLYIQSWMKDSICKDYCLIKRLYLDKRQWEVHRNDIEFFYIPTFQLNSIDNLSIKKVLTENVFVDADDRFYGFSKRKPAEWKKEMYLKWINLSFAEIIKEEELKKLYLSVFETGKLMIQRELVHFIKKVFLQDKYTTISDEKGFITEIIKIISPEYKVILDLPKDFPHKYMQQLLRIDINPIAITNEYTDESDESKRNYLSSDDCDKIINEIRIDDDDRLARFVISLMKAVRPDNIAGILNRINTQKIFLVFNEFNKKILVSWDYMKDLDRRGALFYSQSELYKDFSETISNSKIARLVNEGLEKIIDIQPIKCNIQNVLEFIAKKKPDLQYKSNRQRLISYINNINYNYNIILSIRYLLHTSKQNFDDYEALYFGSNNDVWNRLMLIYLRTTKNEWRLIDNSLVESISQNELTRLNIHRIDENRVQKDIENVSNSNRFDCASLSEKERAEIIRDFKKIKVLKQIPIFEDLSGNLVPVIDKITFIASADLDIPDYVKKQVSLLTDNKILTDRGICSKISSNVLIDIALSSDSLDKSFTFIVGNLLKVSSISSDLKEKLQSVHWLPLTNGNFGSFEHLIHIKGLENIVSEINDGSIIDYKMLINELKDEKVWVKIESLQLLNNFEQSIDEVKKILLRESENHFGDIAEHFTKEDYEFFLTTFDSSNLIFPITRIILRIKDLINETNMFNSFIRAFFIGTISQTRAIQLLNFLYERYSSSDRPTRKQIIKLYNRYLKNICSHSNITSTISNISLLNQNREWAKAENLCYGVHDISKKYLLDREMAELLNNKIKKISYLNIKNYINPNLERLIKLDKFEKIPIEEYFDNLADKTNTDLVGLFLSCFNNKTYTKLANERYLTNNRSVQQIRGLLNETLTKDEDENPDWNLNKILTKENCRIEIQNKNEKYFADSIIDTELIISLEDCIINEYLHIEDNDNSKILLKGFSKLDETQKLLPAFKNTFIEHLYKMYKKYPKIYNPEHKVGLPREAPIRISFPKVRLISNGKFNELWENFANSDQKTIDMVQKQVVEELIPKLRELKVENPSVDALFLKYDERWNNEIAGSGNRKVYAVKDEILELSNRLFTQSNFAEDIFEAVQAKMGIYQYDQRSVLFELFQNADDAVEELIEMGLEPKNKEFLVNYSNNNLAVMHWGRKINQERGAVPNSEISRKRRYNDDVIKMLSFGYSRKDENQTGKYGLGFKSIYTICSSPKIISGNLAFKISGAIYPLKLSESEKVELASKLIYPQSGTIITMDLVPTVNLKDVLHDFRRFAYLQTCFSRDIEKIKINDNYYESNRICVLGIETIFIVNVDEENVGLLFKSEYGSIVFKLDSYGICKFPDDIPTVWVTVPTREKDHIGFIINSSFDIDIGRTQLTSNTDVNYILAQRMGKDLYKQLIELYQKSSTDFSLFKKNVKLSIESDIYSFWDSFFNIVTSNVKSNSSSKSVNIAYQILWSNDSLGYYCFIKNCDVIPNGFSVEYKRLISLTKIKYKISGILSDKIELLDLILRNSDNCRLEDIKLHGINSKIINKLPSINYLDIKDLNLSDFIMIINDDNEEVAPQIANNLGLVITEDLFKALSDNEKKGLKECLKKLKFQSIGSDFFNSKQLMIMDKKYRKEEYLRGSFAPEDKILSESYNQNGVNFLVFCRCELGFSAEVKTLTKWSNDANTKVKKTAVLNYIKNGELGSLLASSLRDQIFLPEWLIRLREENINSDLLVDFDYHSQGVILAQLGFREERSSYNRLDSYEVVTKAKEIDWDDVIKYWKANKDVSIKRYEDSMYPSFFDKSKITNDTEDEQVRKNWMILFILGITHTFGFENTASNRRFIERIERNDLLRFISNYGNKEKKQPELWIEKYIDPFIDSSVNNEEYRIWLNSFSSIYTISKYLDVYIIRFHEGIKLPDRGLKKSLFPKTDYDSYENLPPLNRSLNMGANFILRELVRFNNGNIEDENIFNDCFVPRKNIRELFDLDINKGSFEDSKIIYKEIVNKVGKENATFNYSFDLAISEYLKNIGE